MVSTSDIASASTLTPAQTAIGVQGLLDINNLHNYLNAPMDPRMRSQNPYYAGLKQGIIQQADSWVQGVGRGQAVTDSGDLNGGTLSTQQYPFGVRFLFNPSGINVSYQTDPSVLPLGQTTEAQAAALSFYPGSTSINFSLQFDRTYEVVYGPNATTATTAGKDLRGIGVYEDIGFLEKVIGARGLLRDSSNQPQLSNMVMVPVVIIFGGGDGKGGVAAAVGLSYYAFINSVSVTYSHFARNMVPIRAGVDINATMIIGSSPADAAKSGDLRSQIRTAAGRAATTTGSGSKSPQSLGGRSSKRFS